MRRLGAVGLASQTEAVETCGRNSGPTRLVEPLAVEILDYRENHGAFSSVDELDAVPGIGPKRLEQLRELVVP